MQVSSVSQEDGVASEVLLVCAEDLRAQLALRMLRNAKIGIERVKTPEEVAPTVKSKPGVRLLLCDWRLAAADASKWVERWRVEDGLKRQQILLISDRLPTNAETADLFQKGVNDIWVRPLPDYLLLPRLKMWLNLTLGVQGGGSGPVGQAGTPVPAKPSAPQTSSAAKPQAIDPQTQLMAHPLFLDLAEGMFTGSRRLGLYVGCLAISVSNLDQLTAQLGPQGRTEVLLFLAQELARLKRQEDLLGRWDTTTFVMATYFPQGQSVQEFGRRILLELQSLRFPHATMTGPLRFLVTGAWGPSRDYPLAKETLELIVQQTRTPAR